MSRGPSPAFRRLTTRRILAWADAHHRRTGRWPNEQSGPITDAPSLKWRQLDSALRLGMRGLPGGSSLARLLAKRRGVRNIAVLPRVTAKQILAWADAYHERTGRWPNDMSGPIAGTRGVAWLTVEKALQRGLAGRPAGWSLARFLAEERQARIMHYLPRMTLKKILAWADAHRRRTGQWPRSHDGDLVADASGETWRGVDSALRWGIRGLSGGSSLARLLAKHRGVHNKSSPPPLTIRQILAWADLHRQRTGCWPNKVSGPIPNAGPETWLTVDSALVAGRRGLAGGSSLAQFLAAHGKGGRHFNRQPLTLPQILAWADAHYRRRGRWPIRVSGRIRGTPGETWGSVDYALRNRGRGLPGRSSLYLLMKKHRPIAEAAMQASSSGRKG